MSTITKTGRKGVAAKDVLEVSSPAKVAVALDKLSGGGGVAFSSVVWADSAASSDGDGTSGSPFKSLQAAVTFSETLEAWDKTVILIAPDSKFDEDVTIVSPMLSIMGLGSWTLGDGAGSAYSSTIARNMSWDPDRGQFEGKWPSLVLGTLLDEETSSTHTAYLNGAVISGDLLVLGTTPAALTSRNIQLRNVKVKGNYDTTAMTPHGLQTYLRRCFFDNAFNSPSGLLNIVESCEFDGTLIAGQINRMWQCELGDGATVSEAPLTSLKPNGITNCDIKGTWTGPAGSFLIDAVTNYKWNNNGGTLAGGATKVIMHDLT